MKTCLLALVVVAAACGPDGKAPIIEPIEDQVVAVNDELVIRINGTDPDGDSLDYSYSSTIPDVRSRATLSVLPVGAGEFRWRPNAMDVGEWAIDFKVDDGSNEVVWTVNVDVRAAVGANSAPSFEEPLGKGTSIDLSETRCASLRVVVRDSDSTQVQIKQGDPIIEGAELEQDGAKEARWSWCPTEAQKDNSDRYTLTLVADDGDNPPTQIRFLIVLRGRSPKGACAGSEPVIAHTPSDQLSPANVWISAGVTDAEGLQDAPLLYWSEADPGSTPNLGTMNQVVMTAAGGDLWEVLLPNSTATQPDGSSTNIYYVILAKDNDDPTGPCDHEVLAPSTGAFEMFVENPGGPGLQPECEPCVSDNQCGTGESDLCVRVGSAGESFCLSGCEFTADCPNGFFCSADSLESIGGAMAKQCVPDAITCRPELDCIDDVYEDNDNATLADMKSPITAGMFDAMSCPLSEQDDDEDWYRIDITTETQIDLVLAGTSATDLDLVLKREDGSTAAFGVTVLSSNEALSYCATPGTYYAKVVAYGIGANPYSLDYSATSGSCGGIGSTCTPDSFEDNNSPWNATIIQDVSYDSELAGDTLTICSLDEDWYDLYVLGGETVTALISFTHGVGDLDMHLVRLDDADDSVIVLDSSQSTTNDELVQTVVPGSVSNDIYYIVVSGWLGAENTYELLLDIEP